MARKQGDKKIKSMQISKRNVTNNKLLNEISELKNSLNALIHFTSEEKLRRTGFLSKNEVLIHWYLTFIAGLFTGFIATILTSVVLLKGEAYAVGLVVISILIFVLFFLGLWLLLTFINNPKWHKHVK